MPHAAPQGVKTGWAVAGTKVLQCPVVWRFHRQAGDKSGRGLPQSKTLRAHAPKRLFHVSQPQCAELRATWTSAPELSTTGVGPRKAQPRTVPD